MTGRAIDDTVQGEIVPTDLYSLIHPVREAQLDLFGRSMLSPDYEERMLALAEGKPQQRLKNDRIAREVVRAILTTTDWNHYPTWVTVTGRGRSTSGATTFPEVLDTDIRQRLHALMDEGLLNVTFCSCGDPGSWYFESEVLSDQVEIPPFNTANPIKVPRDRFVLNVPLREAVTTMLKPFEAEKPMYVHPKE